MYDDDNSDDENGDASSYKDTGVIRYKDTNGNETVLKPNLRFLHYKSIFQNLVLTQSIVTMYPVIWMTITYDATRAIAVTKKDERESYIRMYSLKNHDLLFTEKIGGGPN